MKRKFITCFAIMAMTLLVSIGCSAEDADYPIMEEVTIDFPVTDIETPAFNLQHATDTWMYDDQIFNGVPVIFETATLTSELGTNNLNFNITETSEKELTQKFADQLLLEAKLILEPQGIVIDFSEVRKLGDTPLLYVEQETILTDDLIDLMVSEGILTEEQIQLSGGREVLKNTTSKQIAFYVIKNEKMVVMTGTYFDESGKDSVLEAMKLITQTLEVL